MLTLDVAICTFGSDAPRRLSAMALPQVRGVRYVVSWQQPARYSYPPISSMPLAARSDVEIHTLPGEGLSRNRNNVIALCRSDLILLADDDLAYTPARLQAVIDTFESHPDVDIAAFRYDGAPVKHYPDTSFDLRRMPRGYYVSSIEIGLRRSSLPQGLRFDERFGIGTTLPASEEYLFVAQAVSHYGLSGYFFPLTVTCHNGGDTATCRTPRAALRANVAAYRLIHGLFATVVRAPFMAWCRAGGFATRLAYIAVALAACFSPLPATSDDSKNNRDLGNVFAPSHNYICHD